MTRDRHMMGAAAHFTTAEGSHREVQPERLQMLGKRASALFVEQGIPLTDAVVRVLSEENGLSRNHVQRVTEFANNYAFEDLFNKEASDHRVIDFGEQGPADTSEVLKELNSVGREQIKMAAKQPSINRRFVPGQDSERDSYALSKTAAAASSYPYVDPYKELGELRESVGRAKEEMLQKISESGLEYEAASRRLYNLTKQAVLGGYSPADVANAFVQRAPDKVMVKLALKEIAQRMDNDHIPAMPITKRASASVVNPEHPLMKAFNDFVKTAMDYFGKIKAAEDLSEQYTKVDRKLRGMIQ